MLRITVDIIPWGNEEHRETIGVMDIINDATGTSKIGNYKIKYYDNDFLDCIDTEIKRYDRSKGFLELISKTFNKIRRIKNV